MGRFEELTRVRPRLRDVKFTSLDGREWICDLGLLSAEDDLVVLERAAEAARARKGKAERGDPLFDFACACEIVALAAIDSASSDREPVPFFPNGGTDVRRNLDRDRVFYLQERQAAFQDSLSPLKRALSEEEYRAKIVALAVEGAADANPFAGWAPSLVMEFARFTARLCLSSLTSKSTSTGNSSTAPFATTNASRPSSTDEGADRA